MKRELLTLTKLVVVLAYGSKDAGSTPAAATGSSWIFCSIFMRDCACLARFFAPWPNRAIKCLRCATRRHRSVQARARQGAQRAVVLLRRARQEEGARHQPDEPRRHRRRRRGASADGAGPARASRRPCRSHRPRTCAAEPCAAARRPRSERRLST